MSGYRASQLSNRHHLPDRISTVERKNYMVVFSKIRALMANGLTEIDLVRCWVAWRVLPLSRRPGLMCEYTSELKDPQRHCQIEMTDKDINNMTKSLLNESLQDCSKVRLNPLLCSQQSAGCKLLTNFVIESYLHLYCHLIPI